MRVLRLNGHSERVNERKRVRERLIARVCGNRQRVTEVRMNGLCEEFIK